MITLLILLNVCHWLADYTMLSTPTMLAAKKFGKPLRPIWTHAATHGTLMGLVLTFYLKGGIDAFLITVVAMSFESITHFTIDILKGRMNVWYPPAANPAKTIHWTIFGFDQLLHQIVIIIIAYYATK